ncbi:putative carboxylesterase 15 [Acorus calamus]|uniref:Carboxylesterase 15 n=1 Tax=Acorus calamus TaxID=4465 RepID=A0AAV9CZP0_ACOCL|nr:putative carboxylesterase 15 [Acorus calamus]
MFTTTPNHPPKTIVEDISGWLRLYSDGTVDRTWTGPPQILSAFQTIPPTNGDYVDGVATHDVILDPLSDVLFRLYLPLPSPHHPHLPLLLHFQGGGFCVSRPTWRMYHEFYSRLVRSLPAACVSVQTRLAPEHRLPAAVDDCLSALSWLRSSPSDVLASAGVDLTRVFLIGDSSGGNLVHQVAARAGDVSPVRIAGAIPIHPGFVRARRSASEKDLGNESPMLTLDMLDRFLALALPEGETKDHPITCPMGEEGFVEEVVGQMPPMMVVVAEKDLIRDTEMEYVEAARKAGLEVEVLVNEGVGHSFYLNSFAVKEDPKTAEETEKLIDGIRDFVRRH